MIDTPELDKQKRVIDSGRAETVQDLIDWLPTRGYRLAEYIQYEGYSEPRLVEANVIPEQLMADFFGIDLAKIEAERRAILDALRGGD